MQNTQPEPRPEASQRAEQGPCAPASGPKRARPVFFRPRDAFFLLALLALAGGIWLYFRLNAAPGGRAVVSVVTESGSTTLDIPLNRDGLHSIENARLPVTLQVENGSIRFINSVCPDHLCEYMGWLHYENEEAICVPAGVSVRVQEERAG